MPRSNQKLARQNLLAYCGKQRAGQDVVWAGLQAQVSQLTLAFHKWKSIHVFYQSTRGSEGSEFGATVASFKLKNVIKLKVRRVEKNKESSGMFVTSVMLHGTVIITDRHNHRQFKVMAISHCFFSLLWLPTFPSILEFITREWLSSL